jgi:hypothetical protein
MNLEFEPAGALVTATLAASAIEGDTARASLLVVALSLLKMAGLKPLVVWLVFLAPPIHMFAQLRGAYSLGVGSTLWRTLVLLFVSGTVFTLYLLFILVMSVKA